MRSGLRLAAVLLAVLCLGLAGFFGLKILKTEWEYREGISTYDRIAELAAVTDSTETDDREGPGEIPASSVPRQSGTSSEEASGDGASVTLFPEKDADPSASGGLNPENTEKPSDIPEIDFKALQEVNPDVIGWICSPGTTINYPVSQGSDNEYYLTHLADGTENRNGCPFMDVQNSRDFSDANSVVYGHHMQNGTMFAGISWYEDQNYYDEHPVMYLMTPEKTYRIELFSGYTTTMDSSAYMLTFGSIREHTGWLKEISRKSDFRTNLEISAYDRVITLSTCAYSFENARYVLHGKLVELH